MYESISKNNELENEMTLDMSYFWYSDNHWPQILSKLWIDVLLIYFMNTYVLYTKIIP